MKENKSKRSKYKPSFSDVIAVIALVISIASISWTIYSDQKSNEEVINIFQSGTAVNGTTKFDKGFTDEIAGFYTEQVNLVISNNSKRDISIINADSEILYDKNILSYSNLIDYSELELPINLESHKTVVKTITIKYPLPKKSFEIASSQFSVNSNPPLNSFLKTIYRNKIDQFGNDISYQEFSNDGYLLTYDIKREIPITLLTLITSEGNRFICELTPK